MSGAVQVFDAMSVFNAIEARFQDEETKSWLMDLIGPFADAYSNLKNENDDLNTKLDDANAAVSKYKLENSRLKDNIPELVYNFLLANKEGFNGVSNATRELTYSVATRAVTSLTNGETISYKRLLCLYEEEMGVTSAVVLSTFTKDFISNNISCCTQRNNYKFTPEDHSLLGFVGVIASKYMSQKGTTSVSLSTRLTNSPSSSPWYLMNANNLTASQCSTLLKHFETKSKNEVTKSFIGEISAMQARKATVPIGSIYKLFILYANIWERTIISNAQYTRFISSIRKDSNLLKQVNRILSLAGINLVLTKANLNVLLSQTETLNNLYRFFNVITLSVDFAGMTTEINPFDRVGNYYGYSKNGSVTIFGETISNCSLESVILIALTQYLLSKGMTIGGIELRERKFDCEQELFNGLYDLTDNGKFTAFRGGNKGEWAAVFNSVLVDYYFGSTFKDHMKTQREEGMLQCILIDENLKSSLKNLFTDPHDNEIHHTLINIDYSSCTTIQEALNQRSKYIENLSKAVWNTRSKYSYRMYSDNLETAIDCSESSISESTKWLCKQLEDNYHSYKCPVNELTRIQKTLRINNCIDALEEFGLEFVEGKERIDVCDFARSITW